MALEDDLEGEYWDPNYERVVTVEAASKSGEYHVTSKEDDSLSQPWRTASPDRIVQDLERGDLQRDIPDRSSPWGPLERFIPRRKYDYGR